MSPLFESPTLDPLVLPGPNPTGLDLSLSISLRPVPGRLVQLIRSGRFIEMRDLLYDNSTLRGHYEGLHGSTGLQLLPVSSRPRVREVTTLSSWICCYLTYCAVQAPDQATRDRMTYAILVVREAMRHGGQGWLDYDRLFRQQAAINPGLQWNAIHPQLQATTVLNQRPTAQGNFCTLCQECDHSSSQCALAQVQQSAGRSGVGAYRPPSRPSSRICASWNDGACIFPGTCNYRHICLNCRLPSHPARDCRLPQRSRMGNLPVRTSATATTRSSSS